MNIFAVSPDPVECAQCLDDLRLNKMITETFQILCTAAYLNGVRETPFRPTHHKHPCVRWAAKSMYNYCWTVELARAMLDEWTYRQEKSHLSGLKCLDFVVNASWIIPIADKTPFVNCSLFKEESCIHYAYRMTLLKKWANDKKEPRWTNRQPPSWIQLIY